MEKEVIYNTLYDAENLAGHENLLREYLVSQVERYDRADEDPKNIAYEMAGLLGTPPIMELPRDHPFKRVLEMAGQLELPEPHRSSDATWEELKRLVRQLP